MSTVMFYSNIILILWYGSVLTTAVNTPSFSSLHLDAPVSTQCDKTGKLQSALEM